MINHDVLEDQTYEAFRKKCEETGLLQRPVDLAVNDALDGVNDETTLRRFLRADKGDVDKAFLRYREACAVREKTHLLQLYEEIDVEDFEKARILYPHWSGRRDKRGNPICLFDISRLDSKVLSEYSTSRTSAASGPSPALLRSLAFHECLTRFVLPLCTASAPHSQPVTACLYLVDITGFGIKQAWSVKNYAQDISKVLANNYPEMVDKVLVVGAPRYFGQIWKMLKGWLDPVTAAKIEILDSADVTKTLSQFIDLENIPKQFGGSFEFEHGMLPNVELRIQEVLDGVLPAGCSLAGPFKWVVNEAGKRSVVPLGTVKGARRDKAVQKVGAV